jgi:23S rRNA pseudouridine2605 synthase
MNRNSNPKKTGRNGKTGTERSNSVKSGTGKPSRQTKPLSAQSRKSKTERRNNRNPNRPVSTSADASHSDKARSFRSGKNEKENPFTKSNKKASVNKWHKPQKESTETFGGEGQRAGSRFKKTNPHGNSGRKPENREKKSAAETTADGSTRLNKYISNAGICSRREADVFIENGVVTVNGKLVDQVGYKVQPGDVVKFDGRAIIPEKPVYLLLNKPKDYITTSEDPQGRRTVMSLIRDACKERVFPVGRLDRNTTGLLLFTNDGEMADKLMHPKKRIKKIYAAELDKNLKTDHLRQIREGLQLEDGFIKPDAVDYSDMGKGSKKVIGIEIHSGRNRIVRRIFEHLGYTVLKLDRVYFAGLTKKNLPRGKHRMLEPMEINMLKML